MNKRKIIVTITPPTPNGSLHLGHIAGPFLAADIFARIQRMRGHEVVFLCYSDDYQSYVDRKAREWGLQRFELARYFSHEIVHTLQSAEIELDCFLKAYQHPYYEEMVRFLYAQAHRKGVITRNEELVPYSAVDDVWGYEAFGRGTCNYCGHASDASQCEHCAQAPDLHKMGDIVSIISGTPMEWVSVSREFLDLARYRDSLREHYRGIPLRGYLRKYLDFTLSRADLSWAIDRPHECGIDVSIDGHSNRIHTWFSGMAGYMAAFKEFADRAGRPEMFREYWYDQRTKIVHFLGYDCSFSHGIVYPSLLRNVDGMTTDVQLYPNRFLMLEGKDFSTSRGIAIWVKDILREAPVAAVRFYLALHSPEEETTNFEREDFGAWLNGTFMPGVEKIKGAARDAKDWPDGETDLDSNDREMARGIIRRWNGYAEVEDFSIRQMARALNGLLQYICRIPSEEDTRIGILGRLYLTLAAAVHPGLSGEILEEKTQNISGWTIMRSLS